MQRSGPVDGTPAEAEVFTTVLTSGPIARADIARLTGLSSAAVTRVAKLLIDEGYLEYAPGEPAASDETRMGRPSSPLRVHADQTGSFGVIVRRDELIGMVCDLAGGPRVAERRPLTDNRVEPAVAAVAAFYRDLAASAQRLGFVDPPAHLGLSLSGDIDHDTGYVRYSPFLGWRDVDLGAAVSRAVAAPVVVENDVKALTVAEQWFGLGRGITNFAVVTIGTGIGCAIVVDGGLVRGAHSVAGEIGHLPLGDPAVQCHCGAHGCVEAEASTKALLDRCRAATGRDDLTIGAAVELARAGDDGVRAIFSRAGQVIGLALASVANLLGPERVIVAGEGVSSYDLFETAIREAFAEQAFGAAHQVPIHVRDLPFEEWARGAAAVAIQELVFPSRQRVANDMRRRTGVRRG
ncbi:ROK family transcriptional regulator [Jiangella asiatica]|uniref:ROK family transcriptional regulator n=1 Tax=Jiangella asiatica TaxID=2530372 RepID=A0A4R5DQN9_9ACTN|nr:ROK family transcriptional regulator [Jiangella asiatica]